MMREFGRTWSAERLARLPRPIDNFMKHVEPDTNGGCWLWSASMLFDTGYGKFVLARKFEPASRASWILHNGPIPTGLFVCHKCDVRACVNPTHLFLGTPGENVRDMYAKGRSNTPHGERAGMTRLTAPQVVTIKRELRRGTSQASLGRTFGVHAATIQAINEGRTWRHVTVEHFDDTPSEARTAVQLNAKNVAAGLVRA